MDEMNFWNPNYFGVLGFPLLGFLISGRLRPPKDTPLECVHFHWSHWFAVKHFLWVVHSIPEIPLCFCSGSALVRNFWNFYRTTLCVSAVFAVVRCPSLTLVHCIHTAEDIVLLRSQPSSPITVVL